mmetsp:Transcript_21862/g.50274  ORF Transcript_21862/g.50274 Transcript_21862/m.50274 type:complete len:215 (+) Transcript_21862:228-872(+)
MALHSACWSCRDPTVLCQRTMGSLGILVTSFTTQRPPAQLIESSASLLSTYDLCTDAVARRLLGAESGVFVAASPWSEETLTSESSLCTAPHAFFSGLLRLAADACSVSEVGARPGVESLRPRLSAVGFPTARFGSNAGANSEPPTGCTSAAETAAAPRGSTSLTSSLPTSDDCSSSTYTRAERAQHACGAGTVKSNEGNDKETQGDRDPTRKS